MFRDALLFAARLTVGGYVAAHGAQKLLGAFGGHGIEGTGQFFESVGLRPGPSMAAAAGTSELVGGALTATGLAHPVGPSAVAATMTVASGTVHAGEGAFSSDGGPELPLANMAACLALAASGPGRISVDRLLGIKVPPRVATLVATVGGVTAAGLIARAHTASDDASEDHYEAGDDQGASRDEERMSA